jgi:phosphatidylserine/phosphatidylglycerophosphate/cardiolipin synthase-like enzyme
MRLSASSLALAFSSFVWFAAGGFACSSSAASDDSATKAKDGGSSQSDDDGDTTGDEGGTTTTGDGGGPGYSSALSVIVEPSDKGDALLNAIKAAKTSIHMTMYLLTDTDTIDALVAQQKAGLDVKVVLNETFPSGQGNSNSGAYATLHSTSAGMVVYAASTFTYTHEKCIILDGTNAWINTMNATNSAPTANREYLVNDTDAADVAEADAIFQADFAHTPITPSGNLLVAPDNDKARIRALIGTATKSVDVEVEELSDYDVVNDLAIQADNGSKVRIVLSDITPSGAQNTGVTKLKAHSNVSLVVVHDPYIHAKAIIVDGARMYVGSANLTDNSMDSNRELGLVTETSSAIGPVQTAINTDFSAGTAL